MRLLDASTSAILSIASNRVISVLLSPGQPVLASTSATAWITSDAHGGCKVFEGTGYMMAVTYRTRHPGYRPGPARWPGVRPPARDDLDLMITAWVATPSSCSSKRSVTLFRHGSASLPALPVGPLLAGAGAVDTWPPSPMRISGPGDAAPADRTEGVTGFRHSSAGPPVTLAAGVRAEPGQHTRALRQRLAALRAASAPIVSHVCSGGAVASAQDRDDPAEAVASPPGDDRLVDGQLLRGDRAEVEAGGAMFGRVTSPSHVVASHAVQVSVVVFSFTDRTVQGQDELDVGQLTPVDELHAAQWTPGADPLGRLL